jgi:hypothetical protein
MEALDILQKRWFLQELQAVTSQKTTFFITFHWYFVCKHYSISRLQHMHIWQTCIFCAYLRYRRVSLHLAEHSQFASCGSTGNKNPPSSIRLNADVSVLRLCPVYFGLSFKGNQHCGLCAQLYSDPKQRMCPAG